MEYDTCMSERRGVKLRRLPDGPVQDAFEIGLAGCFLELDLAGLEFPLGALLEVQQGSMLYLGELRERHGATALVHVEHMLDRSKLKPIQEVWG